MYSDFNYRPPPPSYQASMQEYRLRLLLVDRHNGTGVPGTGPSLGAGSAAALGAISPPPLYRSQLRNAMANAMIHSRPPSYRSQTSEQIQQNSNSNTNQQIRHSRDPSQISSQQVVASQPTSTRAVNHSSVTAMPGDHDHVVSVPVVHSNAIMVKNSPEKTLDHHDHEDIIPSSKSGKMKESNLVTIVQTSSAASSEVNSELNSGTESSVIVTVSGSVDQRNLRATPGEVQILAHL